MTAFAYYNEIDENAVAWLNELIKAKVIPDGVVDNRSILDVFPEDLKGFTQHHFFAGIGGWAYALRLAGWPDERSVWTGSCPCQPWSSASHGKGGGFSSTLDLWPTWSNFIVSERPSTIFGEQVAHSGSWIDRLCDDLEAVDYEVGAAILPACSVGFDHKRERIFWVARDTNSNSKSGVSVNAEAQRVSTDRSVAASVVPPNGFPYHVAFMRGFGNAIVPQLGATFIEAFLDITK